MPGKGSTSGIGGKTPSLHCRWLLVLVLVFVVSAAWADGGLTFDDRVYGWEQVAQRAETGLVEEFQNTDLDETKQELQRMLRDVAQVRDRARKQLEQAQTELGQLGESPEERNGKDPREDEAVAALRTELSERVTRLAGQVTRSERMETRGSRLLESIAWLEQRKFRERLLNRGPEPLKPATWNQAAADATALARDLGETAQKWWKARQKDGFVSGEVLLAVLMTLLGLLAGWPIRLWIISHLGRDPHDEHPTYARRILGAVGDGLANAVIPTAMIALVILGLRLQGLLVGDFGILVAAAGTAVGVYLMVRGLARAALSPSLVAWRIVPVDPGYSTTLLLSIRWLAAVMVGTSFVMFVLLRTGLYTAPLDAVFFMLQTVAVALLGSWALRPRYWANSVSQSQAMGGVDDPVDVPADAPKDAPKDASAQAPPEKVFMTDGSPVADGQQVTSITRWLHRMRRVLRVILLLAPVAALMGYSRLAYFTQSRLLATAALIGFFLLVAIAVRELLERFFAGTQAQNGRGKEESERAVQGMVFWSCLLTNTLLLLVLICVVLLSFGLPPLAMGMWAREVLTGFEVGGVTIAPGNLITALLLVAVTLVLTNLLRRWLTSHVLPNTKLDYGARNSVLAGTTYLGVGIAMVLALSSFGLNLTNLALIAGALSLGIGFGLRNAVENFAAGLLLLIERPIKVGDWVVVGQTEGTVRQISVRSTEIETFDRASVIVPNSELVSTSVTNWTHKHRLARIIIKAGVAHDSDTALVLETLLQCGTEHPKVLQLPPPKAYLLGFGESCLKFDLRVFIGNTDDFLEVQSELHLAVHKAFREQGIRMPFPQRDITVQQQWPAQELFRQQPGTS